MASGPNLFEWLHPFCTSIYASQAGPQNITILGSGCYINPESLFEGSPRSGYLLTCEHVISQSSNITHIYVLPPLSHHWLEVELIREGENKNTYVDVNVDLAVVRLFNNPDDSGVNSSYDSRFPTVATVLPKIGDLAYIIGNPGGVDDDSFAGGYVRDNKYLPPTGNHECLSTDIAISAGNSGSSLFNNFGSIIGIVSHGYSNINDHTYGPNAETIRLVLPYIMGSDEYRQTTLKGRYLNVNFVANPVNSNPINAINMLGGNAMNIGILPDNITPLPDWTSAFITSYDIFADPEENNKLEEVLTGDIVGGNGFSKALFMPNVDHILFKGYFVGSSDTNQWRWPPLSSQE